ncbi:hypothetical protein [Arthrobacter sp.]|uniref:DUF7927 domain-containing protein n=1 Tax=Arthrobacter sp. TaxID=1667 RepID=UPI0028118573|nr:hypothetical protein [Arthrobacter sp.]
MPRADGPPKGTGKQRGLSAGVVTVISALTLALLPAGAANAAPVYELTAAWEAGTPASVTSGDVVTGIWRLNVNDDAAAPSNAPVENVTFTATVANGRFDAVPTLCLTTGVTPVSSISADGTTLTCNLGTLNQGTAVVIQTPVVADGPTGSQITAAGAVEGQTANLSPINIVNTFGMDMRWGVGTPNFILGSGYYEMDFNWTLSKDKGSDPGPASVTYDLTITSAPASEIQLAPQGCTPYSIPGVADGHPWSGGSHPANQMTTSPTCSIVQTGPNTFQLTVSAINYEPTNPPTLDSAGNRLPVDQVVLTSGSVWVRVLTAASGSAQLASNAPTYTSVTGATAQDDPSNNTESKAWTTPGLYSSGWGRGWTGSGGTNWDTTYQVSAGTQIAQFMDTGMQKFGDRPDDRMVGMCAPLDTKYVTFDSTIPPAGVSGFVVEYYTGADVTLDPASASYDPNSFDCSGTAGWSTSAPADLTQVRGVRYTITQGQLEQYSSMAHISPVVVVTIKPETPVGTDIWSFSDVILDAPLNNWFNTSAGACGNPAPGTRYACTNGFRDLVRVISASPAISKSVDRSVVSPGAPATYTLTYSANGAGAIPATVDGYQIVDTLPSGVTYVAGSATPEPVVTTNGSGQQVLTWTLNGVGTNADHALTYQAVADSTVTPGQTLTNSATASLGGITTLPATAQVTVATNGYTSIGKTADEAFIPNVNGDGVGAGSWTVTVKSFDPLPQAFTDTIDILPYNGDGRGTSYSGSYALTGVTAVGGSTVYYTTADPATLSDDPAGAGNGTAGNVTGNTVGWTTTQPANPTAVRVIGPELAPGATQAFTVAIETTGVTGGDVLVNRAQGRAEHTELVMRTSASITVANYYSASLKKEVRDSNGEWHDANDAVDYPTFRTGDTVPYRITVTNMGQGTLTNVVVSDDRYPAEGGFTIASLAPGATQSHEFEITLGAGVASTFVNTASATADTPADSQVAPTINSDSAGIEVANYTTVKTSDPASGSTVVAGQKVTYTVTVTQTGSVPANAVLTDNLTAVLDDATYNNDAVASVGTVSVVGSGLSWNGTIPVGETATITYSVTVNTPPAGDQILTNAVTSPGCVPVEGQTPDCTTTHPVGAYTVDKSADPASGATATPGQKITYTVTVAQSGPGALTGVSISDDLSAVLDDATFNNDATASAGTVNVTSPTLAWTGDLPVGAVVTITYSVTVAPQGTGDGTITNTISADSAAGAMLRNRRTTHYVSDLTVTKSVDPASGTTVSAGKQLTYTLTFKNTGTGPFAVDYTDLIAGVLDDADVTTAPVSSDPALAASAIANGAFTITGELAADRTVTVTYTVQVKADGARGDNTLANFLFKTGGQPAAACGTGDPLCTTNPISTPAAPAPLANTGATVTGAALLALLALLTGTVLVTIRRRQATPTEEGATPTI